MAELDSFIQSWEKGGYISRGGKHDLFLKEINDDIANERYSLVEKKLFKAHFENPVDPLYLQRLSYLYHSQMRYRDAVKYCIKTMRMMPNPEELYNYFSLLLMKLGKYKIAGRYFTYIIQQLTANSSLSRFNTPFWFGESLEGKVLVVVADRGVGDHVNFFPTIEKLLASYNCLIFYQVKFPYDEILTNSFQHKRLHYFYHFDQIPKCDYLATNISSYYMYIEACQKTFHKPDWPENPYLKVQEKDKKRWQSFLSSASANRKKIGLCWTGHTDSANNAARSIPFLDLSKTLRVFQKSVDFYLLGTRKDDSPFEKEIDKSDLPYVDLRENVKSISDSAAFINQMDLVISVCTAEGHLAGALHKQTILLLSKDHCWRWPIKGEESCFYPKTTLIRQNEKGKWGSVLTDLSERLELIVNTL